MIESILYLLFSTGSVPSSDYIHPCNRDFSGLSTQKRIEMSIGCSTRRGKTVYSPQELEKIMENTP